MGYVDGYVLAVPRKNLAAYRRMAAKAGKIWREHGAVEYRECVGDDLKVKMGVSFVKSVKAKAGETVIFSWIFFKGVAFEPDRGKMRSSFPTELAASNRPTGHTMSPPCVAEH